MFIRFLVNFIGKNLSEAVKSNPQVEDKKTQFLAVAVPPVQPWILLLYRELLAENRETEEIKTCLSPNRDGIKSCGRIKTALHRATLNRPGFQHLGCFTTTGSIGWCRPVRGMMSLATRPVQPV